MSISARNGQNLATKWPERCSNPAGTGPVCHLRRKTASIGRKMGEKGRDPGGGEGAARPLGQFPPEITSILPQMASDGNPKHRGLGRYVNCAGKRAVAAQCVRNGDPPQGGLPAHETPPPPPSPRHSRLCCRGLGRWLRARTGYGQARLGGVGATPIRSALVDRSTDRGHDATLRVATVRPPRMSLTAFAPLTAMRATRARPHYIAHSQI